MRKKDIGTEEVLYRLGLVAALVAATGFLILQYGPPTLQDWVVRYSFCVIYRFTGFTCPGCGGTRAIAALLRGHVLESLLYHPLVAYGGVLYVLFMGSHTLAKLGIFLHRGMKWRDGYAVTAVWLLVANFIIKNLIHLVTGADVLEELGRLFAG